MPISDPSKILFSTAYNYLLNYDSKTGSVSVPATSYAAGQFKSYTVVIPITRTKDFSEVLINFSFDSTKWYIFPQGDVVIDLAFGTVSTVGSYSGSSLTLTFYVVNQIGTPVTNPAFTASVKSLLFVAPA